MSNTLTLNATHRGAKVGLRGDMTGADITVVPTDKKFTLTFYTEDAKIYTITATKQFRINGTRSANQQFSFGGQAGLYAQFTYEPVSGEWVSDKNNLVAKQLPDFSIIALNGAPRGGLKGQVQAKASDEDFDLEWVTLPTSTGGSTEPAPGGTATLNYGEVLLVPDPVTLIATPDLSKGFKFKLNVNQAGITIANPINLNKAQDFTITIKQTGASSFPIKEWGSQYAFDDAQPPVLGSTPGALNLIKVQPSYDVPGDYTSDVTLMTESVPSKNSLGGFGKVVPIARINQTYYLRLRAVDGSGAMENAQPGQTVVVLRNGKGGEGTGNISNKTGGSFVVAGAPVLINPAADQRPILDLLATDYGENPRGSNRLAFGKAILNFEGDADTGLGMTVEIRDLRLKRGRNDDGDARGIAQNGKCTMTVRNVEITDTNNGILTDNATMMPLNVIDSVLDSNGVGTPNSNANQGNNSAGYVHNIYTGHNRQVVTIQRTSFLNSITGHNIKLRSAENYLSQVYSYNATHGRELDLPNGGILEVTDSIFHKASNAAQNNLIAIGNDFGVTQSPESQGEVIDGTRTRRYIFRRCRFINDVDPGRDTSFLATKDPDVQVQFIDCEFVGSGTYSKNSPTPLSQDANYAGMAITNGVYHMPNMPPIWTYTGGPRGPQATPGRPATVPMTAVPA